MSNSIAIASTQKAGEGDAFLLDGLSNPLSVLQGINKQNQQAKQQEKILKSKQDYDTQKAFYDNLSSVNTLGMRTVDLPIVTNGIDDIIKYTNDLKMQGKNPLDINNVQEYMQLQGKLGKMQATVDASKTLQKQLTALERTLASDKTGMFDPIKGYKLVQTGYSEPLERMAGASFELPLAEYNLIPQLDKVTGDNLKTLFNSAKILQNKGAVEDVNKMLGAGKQAYIQSAISLATPAINQGRITTDKVIQDATDYFDYNAKTAVYDDNKDQDQKLQEDKFDWQKTYQRQVLSQNDKKIAIAQQKANQSSTVPMNLDALFEAAANGNQNAVDIINDAQGEDGLKILKVVKGDGVAHPNPLTGQNVVLDPNKTYFKVKKGDKEIWQPADEVGRKDMVNSNWGVNVNQKVRVTGEGKVITPFALYTDDNPNVGSKKSTSTSSKTVNATSTTTKVPAPPAKKTIVFVDNGTEYNIPLDKVDAFIKAKPNAKRK